MKKRIIAIILSVVLIFSSAGMAFAADDGINKISLKKARYIATFHLATLSPVTVEGISEPVTLGGSFDLLDGVALYDSEGNVTHYCFPFVSTAVDGADGYITVSLYNDEPFVTECVFGEMPYSDNTVFVNPDMFFMAKRNNVYVAPAGDTVTAVEVQEIEDDYEEAKATNNGYLASILQLNDATLEVLGKTSLVGFLNTFDKAAFEALLEYYFGRVYFWDADDEANKEVEAFIKENTGDVYKITESYCVDKNYMKPQKQSYYEDEVGDGICGKASVMMILSYYRDAKGFNLPDDETMYKELGEIYDKLDDDFSFAFDSSLIKDKFGEVNSFEIFVFLDIGLAQYLNSKGHKTEASNVLRNMNFSIPLLTSAENTLLLESYRGQAADWMYNQTGGSFTLPLSLNVSANEVVLRSLKKCEPSFVGSLWSMKSESFSNHYFVPVSYYKLQYDLKLWGVIPFGSITKEYVECYDTWSTYSSSVIDWSVFNEASLYCSNSLVTLL